MVARMPPPSPHFIPPEILKSLKLNGGHMTETTPVLGGIFNPWCGTRHNL